MDSERKERYLLFLFLRIQDRSAGEGTFDMSDIKRHSPRSLPKTREISFSSPELRCIAATKQFCQSARPKGIRGIAFRCVAFAHGHYRGIPRRRDCVGRDDGVFVQTF